MAPCRTPLLDVDGTLYGTTAFGGSDCLGQTTTCGTVFEMTTSGAKQVIYTFAGGLDGEAPYAGLIDVGGTLYGTTTYGGIAHTGIVYALKPTRTGYRKKTLYSFANSPDGENPYAALLDVGGTLYGTTHQGGAHESGVVFTITTKGKEQVIYSFADGLDGAGSYAGLVDHGGVLYGTSAYGGNACRLLDACGTVFSITPSNRAGRS